MIQIKQSYYVEHNTKLYKVDVLGDSNNNYTHAIVIGENYFKQLEIKSYEDKVEDVVLRHLKTFVR